MVKKIILFIFFSGYCLSASAQKENIWKQLEAVKFSTVNTEDGFPMDVPTFGPEVKALEGKTIRLKGYIIPLKELQGQNYFVFSRYPFNLCYFCGAAGPETIIEVNSAEEIPFTEDLIELEGRFELNASDPDHMMYLLNEARQLNP
ncbi:hypothetical protein [Nafulsella turpanensis]|uniref:hypothetical protein n=1 Tax=Nafulsella turpanensis TaxID=1265690 RepID=UPI00034A874B|nr:hypothetical protein [Nafulsella turpanensis]